MKLFAQHLIRWQWMVVVLLVGVTGVALAGMTRLRVDPSNQRLLPRQGDASGADRLGSQRRTTRIRR